MSVASDVEDADGQRPRHLDVVARLLGESPLPRRVTAGGPVKASRRGRNTRPLVEEKQKERENFHHLNRGWFVCTYRVEAVSEALAWVPRYLGIAGGSTPYLQVRPRYLGLELSELSFVRTREGRQDDDVVSTSSQQSPSMRRHRRYRRCSRTLLSRSMRMRCLSSQDKSQQNKSETRVVMPDLPGPWSRAPPRLLAGLPADQDKMEMYCMHTYSSSTTTLWVNVGSKHVRMGYMSSPPCEPPWSSSRQHPFAGECPSLQAAVPRRQTRLAGLGEGIRSSVDYSYSVRSRALAETVELQPPKHVGEKGTLGAGTESTGWAV